MAPWHLRIDSGWYVLVEAELEFRDARGLWKRFFGRSRVLMLPVHLFLAAQIRTPEVDLGYRFAVCAEPVISNNRILRK